MERDGTRLADSADEPVAKERKKNPTGKKTKLD
jgi:hypothetical protein